MQDAPTQRPSLPALRTGVLHTPQCTASNSMMHNHPHMIYRVLAAIFSSILCIACSSNTHTAPTSHSVTPTQDSEHQIYIAAIDAFFADPEVQARMTPRWYLQPTLYVQPTFADTQQPIPAPVLEHIRTYTQQLPVREIATPDPRGISVRISRISHDPRAETLAQAKAPTVYLAIQTGRGGVGMTNDDRGYLGIGFYVVQTDNAYTAHLYLRAVP